MRRAPRVASRAVCALGVAVLLAASVQLYPLAREYYFIRKLGSPSYTARFRATIELGEMGSIRAIPAIVGLLEACPGHDAEASEVRGERTRAGNLLVDVLNGMGAEVVPVVARRLRESRGERAYWRRLAVRTLAAHEGEETIRALTEIVGDDYVCVRLQAISALGRMGASSSVAMSALEVACEDENRAVARASRHALETIRAAPREDQGLPLSVGPGESLP